MEVLSKTLASIPQSSTMRRRMLFCAGGVVLVNENPSLSKLESSVRLRRKNFLSVLGMMLAAVKLSMLVVGFTSVCSSIHEPSSSVVDDWTL